MPSAYTQNFYHTVFSTKYRANLIAPDLEARLYPFVGGILRDLRCTLLAINGMPDHVHLLVRYRADLSHSQMLQQIKGRSSKWINETFPQLGRFAWQEGYGGFTVSQKGAAPIPIPPGGRTRSKLEASSALRAETKYGMGVANQGLKSLATSVRPPGGNEEWNGHDFQGLKSLATIVRPPGVELCAPVLWTERGSGPVFAAFPGWSASLRARL